MSPKKYYLRRGSKMISRTIAEIASLDFNGKLELSDEVSDSQSGPWLAYHSIREDIRRAGFPHEGSIETHGFLEARLDAERLKKRFGDIESLSINEKSWNIKPSLPLDKELEEFDKAISLSLQEEMATTKTRATKTDGAGELKKAGEREEELFRTKKAKEKEEAGKKRKKEFRSSLLLASYITAPTMLIGWCIAENPVSIELPTMGVLDVLLFIIQFAFVLLLFAGSVALTIAAFKSKGDSSEFAGLLTVAIFLYSVTGTCIGHFWGDEGHAIRYSNDSRYRTTENLLRDYHDQDGTLYTDEMIQKEAEDIHELWDSL